MTTVAVSGGFDPVHIGHVRMFNAAKKLGDRLVVIVNNDNWLKKKKGYSFMKEEDRKEIIENFASVDSAVLTMHTADDPDDSVCRDLERLKPEIFANGGDRKEDNVPEYTVCDKLGIKMVFNVGGEKLRSSSDLVAESKKRMS